jgi:hypothetical protein
MIDEIESDVDEYEEQYGKTPEPKDIESGVDNSDEIGRFVRANIDDLLSNTSGVVKSLEDMDYSEFNKALNQAIADEDYTKASKIRDIIQGMG